MNHASLKSQDSSSHGEPQKHANCCSQKISIFQPFVGAGNQVPDKRENNA